MHEMSGDIVIETVGSLYSVKSLTLTNDVAELIQLKGGCYSNVSGRYVRYRWTGPPL